MKYMDIMTIISSPPINNSFILSLVRSERPNIKDIPFGIQRNK